MEDDSDAATARRPRRYWGLLALLFLTICLVAVLTSGGGYTVWHLLVLLLGLVGAGYCTYRGLKDFSWLPR